MAAKSREELLIRIDADLKELSKTLKKGDKEAKTFGQKFGSSIKAGAQVGGVALAGLTALAVKSLDAFKDFETQLVAVAKTTNLQGQELKDLRSEIVGLSKEIPVSANELLKYSAIAGQLGVKGVDNLSNFAETIAKLNVATDILGEEGAASITKILNVTGEGVADIDKFGSVLVDLGNNFATTERQIVRTASEVGRATAQFDLGSTNVAGISAALSSLSIQAELGGSVVGKAFRTIDEEIRRGTGEALKNIELLTGMSRQELKQTFETDATLVFQRFIEGLGDVAKTGGSVSGELEKLGLKGDEVNKVLPVLAQRSDLVGAALKRAGNAAVEASALNDEAAQAFDTTASKLQIAENRVSELFVKIGEEIAPEVIETVGVLTEAILENKDSIIAIVDAVALSIKATSTVFKFLQEQADGFNLVLRYIREQTRINEKKDTEFLEKEYAKREGSLADFRKREEEITKKALAEKKKDEKKSAEDITKIDIEKQKEREKIQKAEGEQLAKIEAEKVKRIIELNENELKIIRLQREGATEQEIEREREKREILEEINRLSNNIIELENKDTLNAIEQQALEHSKTLLSINKSKLEDLQQQQIDYGNELVDIVEDTYDEIEDLEQPGTGTQGSGGGAGSTGGEGSPTEPAKPTDTTGQDTPGGGEVILSLGEKSIDDNTYLAKARAGRNCSGVEASRVDNLGRRWCVEGCRGGYQWDSLTLRTCRKKQSGAGEGLPTEEENQEGPDYVGIIAEGVEEAIEDPLTGGLPTGGGGSGAGGGTDIITDIITAPTRWFNQSGSGTRPADSTEIGPMQETNGRGSTQEVKVAVEISLNENATDIISARQKEDDDLGIYTGPI